MLILLLSELTISSYSTIFKTLPEAQRTQSIESITWVNLSTRIVWNWFQWNFLNWLQICPPDGATCIGCQFCHLHMIPNLTTRWRQLHKFHIWPPKLSTRLSHLHCQIALDCPIALLPYCSIALLPYCPIALLPYCLHQTESHQLCLQNVSHLVTSGPIDRTPGTPGSDKNMVSFYT